MEYTLLTNQFGGMNYRKDPAVLGPSLAQDAHRVDLSAGVLQRGTAESIAVSSEVITSSGVFGTTQVKGTNDSASAEYDFGNPYTYHAFGDRVIRIPRYAIVTGWVPQFSTSAASPVWQALGIKKPVAGSFAMASGGAGSLTGAYRAVVVFYNSFGDESPPTASVSFTAAANDIDYSAIPIGYGQGDINSSTSITNVDNPSFFRVGMRITTPGGGIPAGTYITAISGSTITISQAATATTANVELQDAQVTGRRIYRTTAGGTTYYRAVDIANVTAATSTGDNMTDATLEVQSILSTDTDDDVLPAVYGGTISPDGVLMACQSGGVVWFTKEDGSFLTKGDYSFDMTVAASQVVFALNRFVILTYANLCFVLGTAADNYDLIETGLVAPVDNGATYYGGANPVVMPDGSLWFTSRNGVMRYDGNAVDLVTGDVFTDAQNASIGKNTLAALMHRGRYVILTSLDGRTSYQAIQYDPLLPGWSMVRYNDTGAASTGALWSDTSTSPPDLYIYKNTSRIRVTTAVALSTGLYWTGEWSGERRSSLKKFRRVALMHNGTVTVQPYVDGTVAGSAQALVRSTLGRSVFWLPSETKGRTCSVKVTLDTNSEVHEIGVWVGEERGPMP